MITVEFKADPRSPVYRDIDKFNTILSDASMASFLKRFVVDYLQGQAVERFGNEGDEAVGGPWVPLKDITKVIRVEQGFGEGPINVRTGELRAFVVENPGEIGFDVGAKLRWPTDVPGDITYKYNTAQTGTANGKVPARPVVGISFADMAAINLMLGGFINAAMKTAGLS